MREIRTSGSTRGGAPSGPLLLYRLGKNARLQGAWSICGSIRFQQGHYDPDPVQKIGCRNIRPYAMNAIRRPSVPLKTMGVISPYLACTQTNTRLSIDRTVAATTVSAGCQWKAAGTISPTVQTSSRTE